MEATAQLNVRLEPELKKAGDRVLAQHGLTPSQAIRALYRNLTGTKDRAEEAFRAIAEPDPDEQARRAEWDRKLQSVREVQDMIRAFQESHGITEYPPDWPSDKELLEEALWERMQEKGMVSVA